MILQIIAGICGLTAIIGTSEGLVYSEEKHWENVMAEKKRVDWYRNCAIKWGNKTENFAEKFFNIEKECECEEMSKTSEMMDKYNPLLKCFEFGHWLRGKIISKERQEAELIEVIKQTELMIKILGDTLSHVEEEKKIDKVEEESEDYEVVDNEVAQLEEEKQSWEFLLNNLQNKLTTIQV